MSLNLDLDLDLDPVCETCGETPADHWFDGGYYCDDCAACEWCGSPTCEDPEHILWS